MRVFHVGETDSGIVLARIIQIKSIARQENQIVAEILGDRRTAADNKLIDRLVVVGRNPARELKLGRAPIDCQTVFRSQTSLKDVELKRPDNPDDRRRAVRRPEHLRYAFLGKLL